MPATVYVVSSSPKALRGSPLPPGVPPPRKGELYMQIEGLQWQTSMSAPQPTGCSLLISWWGQPSYNTLLLPFSTPPTSSSPFIPVTAAFALHCSAKHFERYLQDMGFLELTLLKGKMIPDIKDIGNKILGKLSISVSTLAEDHPIHGCYPIFANGQRLIGSMTLGITVTFNSSQLPAENENPDPPKPTHPFSAWITKPQSDCLLDQTKTRIASSFERNEDLASADPTLPLYPPTPPSGPVRPPNVKFTDRKKDGNPFAKSPLKRRPGMQGTLEKEIPGQQRSRPSLLAGPHTIARHSKSPGLISSTRDLATWKKEFVKKLSSAKHQQHAHFGSKVVQPHSKLADSVALNGKQGSVKDAPVPSFGECAKDAEDVMNLLQEEPDLQKALESGVLEGLNPKLLNEDSNLRSLQPQAVVDESAQNCCSRTQLGSSIAREKGDKDLSNFPASTLEFQPPVKPKADLCFDPGGGERGDHSKLQVFKISNSDLDVDQVCHNGFQTWKGQLEALDQTGGLKVGNVFVTQNPTGRRMLVGSSSTNHHHQQHSVMNNISELIKRAEAFRDALKKSDFYNMSSITSTTTNTPSAQSTSPELPSSREDDDTGANLLDNVLAVAKVGGAKRPKPAQELVDDTVDLDGEVKASDVAEAALIEALFVNDFRNHTNRPADDGTSGAMILHPSGSETLSFGMSGQNAFIDCNYDQDRGDQQVYVRTSLGASSHDYSKLDEFLNSWHDGPAINGHQNLQLPENQLICPNWVNNTLGQLFTLRVAIGKLVLCGPTIRDLADTDHPSKKLTMTNQVLPSCTCSLKVSFPALVQPHAASEQQISISPINFSTREAVFDHQSQLCWSLPPGHTLQVWRRQFLRVSVSLMWHRLHKLECAGTILLDKVVNAMPNAYRTSLALSVVTSHDSSQRRSSSSSPFRQQQHLKPREKQKPDNHGALPSKRNCAGGLKSLASICEDLAVARVDIMLQLTHDHPTSSAKMEVPITQPFQTAAGRAGPLDLWLHVTLHDIDNCFQKALGSKEQDALLHLVVKSSPQFLCQVPFPMPVGSRGINSVNCSNAVLRVPLQQLEKAVVFIEVWRDDEISRGLGALLGLIKVPLRVPSFRFIADDLQRLYSKPWGQVVADGRFVARDPLKCMVLGTTVHVTATLGLHFQMRRLLHVNRAAMIIQSHVRNYLKRQQCGKSLTITRYWGTGKDKNESKRPKVEIS